MQKVVSSAEQADIYRPVYCKEVSNPPFELKLTAMVSVTAAFYSSSGVVVK
jgi:hypothetical protein